MTTQIASASLTCTASIEIKTGFIPYQEGIIDLSTGTIKPNSDSAWSSLSNSTWESWGNYTLKGKTIRWTAPLVDLGSVKYFTLNIETDFDGTLAFLIHVSETGTFTGEETEYYIEEGDTNVESFYGQYAYVSIILEGTELRQFTITANTETVSYEINNVDTSTLSGTNTARVIALPRPVSSISNIDISCKAATSYAVNLYVSDTANSEILIPVVKSKSATSPTFALYGIDNDPRDGIVDIKITALPRQIMYGGRLTVVS